MKTIAFLNNKGGVGKTTLSYHLAWTFADLDQRVLVADFDPQANLSSMFLAEERLEELWPEGPHDNTVLGAIEPILRGTGDVERPSLEAVGDTIQLLVGDLGLSAFEDQLSEQWPRCLDRKENAFRVISAFHRMMVYANEQVNADVVLIDVGPNLGALNRAVLIAADYVIVPLAPDLFSMQGLRNLGPTLREWRVQWRERLGKAPAQLALPGGSMQPAGYVVLQHNVRKDRPVSAYAKWMARIPGEYHHSVLDEGRIELSVDDDPHCLAQLKHYRSLMPMAMEARKPIFHLRPADGARGAHVSAARRCGDDFRALALSIAKRCGLDVGTGDMTI